jgi:DNA-binding NarL/FixJ family response regulator
MRPIRVMLVDDHPVVRLGYRRLLEQGGDIAVVAEAGNGETAYGLHRNNCPTCA